MHRFFPLEHENEQQVISQHCNCGAIDVITRHLSAVSDVDAAHFAQTCKTIRRKSFPVRHARFSARMYEFLDTLINGRYQDVESMLKRYPNLFMFIPPENMVIENRHTWQKFYAQDALTMMVMLKEMKKIQLLLSCYARFDQTRKEVIEAKNQALAAWKPYEMEGEKGNKTVVIPKEYADLAEQMIHVFLNETFPNGVPGAHKNFYDRDEGVIPWDAQLSEETEQALKFLLDRLVPEKAVKLKDHLDAELVLLAVYRAYIKFLVSVINQQDQPDWDQPGWNQPDWDQLDWDQLDMFCIRVIGLALTAVQRTTGEYFCEDFNSVVYAMDLGEEKAISEQAENLKLHRGENFYRSGRAVRAGQGFEFFCSTHGLAGALRSAAVFRLFVVKEARSLGCFIRQKQQVFGNYAASLASNSAPRPAIPK